MPPESTPTAPFVELSLAGYRVKVSPEDAERVLSRHWYASRCKGRPDYLISQRMTERVVVTTSLHRFILGATPADPMVDHRNGDTMDNRRGNLRFVTPAQNNANSVRWHRDGYKGVKLRCDGKKWTARIQVAGRGIYLGSFATPEDAARAYDAKAREVWGEYALTNFDD